MPIAFTCACGRSIRAKDELAGTKVKCPGCGAPVGVPRPEAAPEEEVGLLPLNDPWADAPPRAEEPPPAPAAEEEMEEVLPADPEEDEADEDGEVSQRERIRRREEREQERDEEKREQRRRRRQRERAYEELVEQGRFRVRGSRGYLGNVNSSVAAGIGAIVVGAVLALFCTLMFRGMGQAVIVIPVGAVVAGVAAIAVGLNRRDD